ncbi:hypothetical protein SDC9_197133 [bioreactor metagenome]|uniref:Glycosyltransferase 2-like domain-containing protein n=1 Tax=bioreactor metagenome TaxID=1076179 RepID=A0A645IFA6_9ZZZZ
MVDQNPDDRLLPILGDYENLFPVRRFRSAPGLSRARNVGLEQITGEVIAFPDDDCTYPPGILRSVADAFDAMLLALQCLGGLLALLLDLLGRAPWLDLADRGGACARAVGVGHLPGACIGAAQHLGMCGQANEGRTGGQTAAQQGHGGLLQLPWPRGASLLQRGWSGRSR